MKKTIESLLTKAIATLLLAYFGLFSYYAAFIVIVMVLTIEVILYFRNK